MEVESAEMEEVDRAREEMVRGRCCAETDTGECIVGDATGSGAGSSSSPSCRWRWMTTDLVAHFRSRLEVNVVNVRDDKYRHLSPLRREPPKLQLLQKG